MTHGPVTVMMLSTPEVAHYAWLGERSWQAYCTRHGYGFEVCRDRLIADMHPNWSKIALVRNKLETQQAGHTLLVDADSLVLQPGTPLDDLLKLPQPIVFANDRPFPLPSIYQLGRHHLLRLRLGRFNLPNAGFILIRNGEYGRYFIHRWLELARNELRSWSDIHPRNQNVLWRGLLNAERKHIHILGNQVLRITHPSQFSHLARLAPFALHFKHDWIDVATVCEYLPDLDLAPSADNRRQG
jgi:hypothetical protein